MFRRRPVILILVIVVLAIYSVVNYYAQEKYLRDDFRRVVATQRNLMNTYLLLSSHLGKTSLWDDLRIQLDEAVKAQHIDFYVLHYKNSALWYGSYENSFNGDEFAPEILDKTVEVPAAVFHTITFGPDYKLTLGIGKNEEWYVEKNMKAFTGILWEEAVYYTLVLTLVSLWVFRDLLIMLYRMRTGKLTSLPTACTYESEILKRGLEGLAASNASLAHQSKTFENQLLPSLKKELLSGRKQPYDFHCTLVRTDINNFSDIFNSHDTTAFLSEINAFFSEVSHIVSRYNGLVHEFVGDEVLYYFKDEDHPNSFVMALSAIRDINEVATQFSERCQREKGYPFTVKSSLAHGKLRFGPLVNGFSFAGSILIETVRILSQVNERDGNVVFFDSRHLPKIAGYCQSVESMQTTLKGFNGTHTLHKYTGHTSLHQVLETLKHDNLICYRSDDDLCAIIKYLKDNHSNLAKEMVVYACGALRMSQATKSRSAVGPALYEWLLKVEAYSAHSKRDEDYKVLSTIIGLVTRLAGPLEFTELYSEKLRLYLQHDDSRVIANTIEVLTHFDYRENKLMRELLNHSDNRVCANSIIYFGRHELSRDIALRLKKMILSDKPDWVVSGLTAITELTAYHLERDPATFRMQLEFMDLFDHVHPLASSENIKIKQVAARAVLLFDRKTADKYKAA